MKKKFKIFSITGLTVIGGFLSVWLTVVQKTIEIAKSVDIKPSSENNRSVAFLNDKQDYEIVNSTLKKPKAKQ